VCASLPEEDQDLPLVTEHGELCRNVCPCESWLFHEWGISQIFNQYMQDLVHVVAVYSVLLLSPYCGPQLMEPVHIPNSIRLLLIRKPTTHFEEPCCEEEDMLSPSPSVRYVNCHTHTHNHVGFAKLLALLRWWPLCASHYCVLTVSAEYCCCAGYSVVHGKNYMTTCLSTHLWRWYCFAHNENIEYEQKWTLSSLHWLYKESKLR